jgi:hypothetical protein
MILIELHPSDHDETIFINPDNIVSVVGIKDLNMDSVSKSVESVITLADGVGLPFEIGKRAMVGTIIELIKEQLK